MTETCRNKALKSQDIHHTWCFFKKEEPLQCSAKTPSQSFYDAFTAFLSSSSSCTVDREENNANDSLCPNVELIKLDLKDDKIDLQSTANTGCNDEKLGGIDPNPENCSSAEAFVANVWLTGGRSSIEKKCSERAISLSVADSSMSRDWSAGKAYKNEYPSNLSSGTSYRNLRSRDGYNKCSQDERKSSVRSTYFRRSTLGVNYQEEFSCDRSKPVEENSFLSPYQHVQRLSSAGDFSSPCHSESQFLKSRNFKLANNGNNESVNSECQLHQHKEEYRKKLRSAGDRCGVSELYHTERAQQNRSSTLRRRNSSSSDGQVMGCDYISTHRNQQHGLCRPVFVLLEKMSKNKIAQLQNEMKMCVEAMNVTETSGSRETGGLKSAQDIAGNCGLINTSASVLPTEVSKISEISRPRENKDDSACAKTEVVISTLHSKRKRKNSEASQFCSNGSDISIPKTVMVADTALNSDSSNSLEKSDIRSPQSEISKSCEKANEVLSVSNTTQGLETSGSNHAPELVEIISGSDGKLEKTFKPEIEKTCSSRVNEKSGCGHSMPETSNSGCLHTAALRAVDQRHFKAGSKLSKFCNSSGSVAATEYAELSPVLGNHSLPFTVTSDTTGLVKELPKTLDKSVILQNAVMPGDVNVFVHPSVDGSKGVPASLDKVGVITASPNTLNPTSSEPLKLKSQGKLAENKPAVNFDMQTQCTDNSEHFPKSSNVDKRKKKRFSNFQNDILGFNTLGALSDCPKDCVKSIISTSFQPPKARKRKAECHVALQEVSGDQNGDADSYIPNFMTHSQSLDESSLTEKWKEATDLEEWWLNDIGNRTNLSSLSSTISSSATSEKSMGSEDFRWCAMLADQSEWPELDLDFSSAAEREKSVDERNRNFPLTAETEQGEKLRGKGAGSCEVGMNKCEDSQLLETAHRSMAKLKCVKRTACRVGKKRQVQWLKLKEAGSLSTCKLTTTIRKEIQVANSERSVTFLSAGMSDNVAVASVVVELDAGDKKPDQVGQVVTASTILSEKETADNGSPSSPVFVSSLPSFISAANSTHTSSAASSDTNVNRDAPFPFNSRDTITHTSSAKACSYAPADALYSHTSVISHGSTSYSNVKCNAAVVPLCHNHSSSTGVPVCQNHVKQNYAVASFSQNLCNSRFEFNPFVKPFIAEPSSAYFLPPASKLGFSQNVSAALLTCTSSDNAASMSSHDQLSRCQTISNEMKLNCETTSQGSSQYQSKAKGITADRTLCPSLPVSEIIQTNNVKHRTPVTCSTMDHHSPLTSDSAITGRITDPGLSTDSSSSSCQTDDDYLAKTEQSTANNDIYQKPNFVCNDLKNTKQFQTSSNTNVCGKDHAVDKNILDHSLPDYLARSKCESPVIKTGLQRHGSSQASDAIGKKDLPKDSQPCFPYTGLYQTFSKSGQGLNCNSCEALDVVSENSSQGFPPEVGSKPCSKDVGRPSSDDDDDDGDAPMYSDCNSDMCSWLAASMGLYTCDCGAAFSDSWSCQQHQSRCSSVIRS